MAARCDAGLHVSLSCRSQHPPESDLFLAQPWRHSPPLPASQHVLTFLTPGISSSHWLNLPATSSVPACVVCLAASVVWQAPELSLETELPRGVYFPRGFINAHNVVHIVSEIHFKKEKKKGAATCEVGRGLVLPVQAGLGFAWGLFFPPSSQILRSYTLRAFKRENQVFRKECAEGGSFTIFLM